jgi:hypothetical protein
MFVNGKERSVLEFVDAKIPEKEISNPNSANTR